MLNLADERFVPILDHSLHSTEWQRLQRQLYFPRFLFSSDPSTAILELVLSNLPSPGDDVPLDAILDFAGDDETQRKLSRLDIWMRRAAQSGKELQEISLDMEESLHDLANHMRLADMRARTSGMRIVLSLPLEIVEELLHLRPRKALDVVFQYKDRKANRLEAELKAPGGALAYIYEAERRFSASS